jgi:hypothetical protein
MLVKFIIPFIVLLIFISIAFSDMGMQMDMEMSNRGSVSTDALLLNIGDYLLLEDGFKLLLE